MAESQGIVLSIEPENLEMGSQLRITYDPNRVLFLTYLLDFKFMVNKAYGSKSILKGDFLTITSSIVGHRLVANYVERTVRTLAVTNLQNIKD